MSITRADWVDWYVEDGRSTVMVEDNVLVLSELATTLVTEVGAGATLAALVDALVSEFGSPPDGDAEAAARVAVQDLVDSGVLVVADGWDLD